MSISNRTPLMIDVQEPKNAMMMVMLNSIKSAITMVSLKNGHYRSSLKLPSGEKVKLVSIKVDNGRAQLAFKNL